MSDKPGISPVGGASVDEQQMAQIREILFGDYSRETAQRIARLEARIAEQDTAWRALLEERIAAVTGAVKGLKGELGLESERQQAALDGLEAALHALLDKLDQRLTLLDSDLQDGNHRLEQSIGEQADSLERLRRHSVDGAELAGMLEALARQLRDPAST